VRSRITLLLKVAYARAYVRIKGGNREPSWVVWEILLPLLAVASVAYTYMILGAPREYIGFVVIGGAMISYWFNVIWGMGNALYWEKETGNLETFMITPAPLEGLLLGMALGGMFNTTLRALSIVLVGTMAFKASFNPSGLPAAFLIFVLTMVALYSLGMCIASIFLMYSRSGWRAAEVLQEPIMFLSGLYYPISIFPTLIQLLASSIPLTIGMDGIRRSLLLGYNLYDLRFHVISLSVMIPVLAYLAKRMLRYMELRAKVEGRLTLRWM